MTPPPSSLRRLAAHAAALLAFACLTASARAAVWLSHTTFAADALPTIHADPGDLAAAQSSAGPGGFYKLRAKFIVPYSPGYYQAIDTHNNNGHQLTGSPGAGQYTVQLYWVAYNASGTLQSTGPFFVQTVTVTPPAGANTGLQADFFNGNNFQTLVRTSPNRERPNDDWGLSGPPGTNVDHFSIRWSGQIEPLFSETYTFTTGSDDGMRVYLANQSEPVAGAYWDHGYYEASGSIQLTANTRYQIRVEFFENGGGATARLFWQSPSQPREIVPLTRLQPPGGVGDSVAPTIVTPPQSQTVSAGGTATFTVVTNGSPVPALQWRKGQAPIAGANGSSLTLTGVQLSDAGTYDVVATNAAGSVTSPPATLTVNAAAGAGTGSGLRGEYFNGTAFNSLVLTRLDADVNFPWNTGAPAQGIGNDNFSVRWTGTVEAPVTGYYTFSTRSDDGVRLKINGATVIDDWNYHPPVDRFSNPVHLTAGSRSSVVLEYFEAGGGAEVSLHWQPPGQSRTVIPTHRLYAEPLGDVAAWQTLVTSSSTLHFSEETDDEGNGNGNWGSSVDRHDFTIPGPGTLRVYTTGPADTRGEILHLNGLGFVSGLDGNGEGGNFLLERPVGPGSYYLLVSGAYQWNETEAYTVYVEFRPDVTAPVITSTLSAAAPIGAAFSYQIAASSSQPVTFAATDLAPGLVVNAAGLISGRPTQPGTFNIRISATNAAGTDTETLVLTTFLVPPHSSISVDRTTIGPGESVVLSAFGSSEAGTLNYINIDQVSPRAGYYGVGETGGETPPNNAHYASPHAYSHTRQLTLTLNTAGTYRFRSAVSDGAAWYPSGNEVTVLVSASGTYLLTVQNGSGGGSYAAGSVVAISAQPPPAGSVFSHWSREAGLGTFASASSANTTFTLGAGAATVKANYATLLAPVISAPPASQTVSAGQNVVFSVTANGALPLTYQWRKDGQPLALGGNRSGVTTAQLTLTAVTTADAGAYDVVVMNAAGATTSVIAHLVVTTVSDNGTPQLRLHRAQ
ncbi:MAG: immunoglobulin domain-containing protein [Opitutaceae bacterium]|nr:immunoglobulin domain-containing protein [Opitutaceae bacterium]